MSNQVDHAPGAALSRRHPANVVALVFGTIFLGLAGLWFAIHGGLLGFDDLRWAFPGLLTAAGVMGILVSILRSGPQRT